MSTTNTENFLFENEYVLFDVTKFPFIYIEHTAHQPTPEEFNDYINCMSRALLRNEPYVLLVDMSKVEYLNTEYRTISENWNKTNSAHLGKHCKGAANLVRDEEQKAILNYVLKLAYDITYPNFVTVSKEKAEQWLEGRV